mmetsp:Transcript_24054/g.42107  ORF Transcript_24054/g.42107 Transcript_24054/m.42107 type:complete len:172 (-) Transcript_24054:125-640(-)
MACRLSLSLAVFFLSVPTPCLTVRAKLAQEGADVIQVAVTRHGQQAMISSSSGGPETQDTLDVLQKFQWRKDSLIGTDEVNDELKFATDKVELIHHGEDGDTIGDECPFSVERNLVTITPSKTSPWKHDLTMSESSGRFILINYAGEGENPEYGLKDDIGDKTTVFFASAE